MEKEPYIKIDLSSITELGLKGNELIIYSIIDGLSVNGCVSYYSLSTFCKWINGTKPTVIKCLKSLEEKELIEKIGTHESGTSIYISTSKKSLHSKEILQSSKEILLGVSKNFTSGSKNSLPNNLCDNTNDNTNDNLYIPSVEGKETQTKKIDDNTIELSSEKKQCSENAEKCAKYLFDEIKKDNPYFKISDSAYSKWVDSFDKCVRLDEYPADVVFEVLKWCKNDSFWRKNIMSGNKFREKLPNLYAKAKNVISTPKSNEPEKIEYKYKLGNDLMEEEEKKRLEWAKEHADVDIEF